MRRFLLACRSWVLCMAAAGSILPVPAVGQTRGDGFDDVLQLAGISAEQLAAFQLEAELGESDQQLISQLLHRLNQFSAKQLDDWAGSDVGVLQEMSARAVSIETVIMPPAEGEEVELFRCEIRGEHGEQLGDILTSQIPRAWHGRKDLQEPIHFLGIPLGPPGSNLWLTNHVEWFPTERVPAGHLLLANQGMDIALLDEVQQRKPFVDAGVSREGEAFYSCLQALGKIPWIELQRVVMTEVRERADEQQALQADLLSKYEALRSQKDENSRADDHIRETEAARREYALATAVAEQGELGVSSVAPLFWHPEENVGKLIRIAGTARRAVRVEVPPEQVVGDFDHYYEMEVFTRDSQNLPIVCCVLELPSGFPEGDKIREAVDVSGVFFKNWRYRTREDVAAAGTAADEQRSFTPVILASKPIWLHDAQASASQWGIWGGAVFLVILGGVWWVLLRQERRDRELRAAATSAQLSFPESPSVPPISSSHPGTTE